MKTSSEKKNKVPKKKVKHNKTKLAGSSIRKKKVDRAPRGVVYLSHIPPGFYEKEMMGFFTQFGKVTGVNIPRSKKTGKFRGYGFVEFLFPDVAKIVAETMNNYLMCNRIMKAKYIPPEEQKPELFKYVKTKIPPLVKKQRKLRRRNNRILKGKKIEKEENRLNESLAKKHALLESLGIDFKFQVRTHLYDNPCVSEPNSSMNSVDSDSDKPVFLIDEGDTSITFTTPPNVVKKIKKTNILNVN